VYSWWLCNFLTAWIHSVLLVAMTYVYSVICSCSEYGNGFLRTSMILCRFLVVCRFPIRCAPGFQHTHAVYKVFWLSLILASYFVGNSVTHDFGHLDGVLTMVYSGSQQELSPEKSDIYLLPENTFSKRVHRLLIA
jgi:hypothetical protein